MICSGKAKRDWCWFQNTSENGLGICIYKTWLLNRPGGHISFTPSCLQGRIKGATGAIASVPPLQGGPRDEIYLFKIKYLFEKFGVSEGIQEYNSI